MYIIRVPLSCSYKLCQTKFWTALDDLLWDSSKMLGSTCHNRLFETVGWNIAKDGSRIQSWTKVNKICVAFDIFVQNSPLALVSWFSYLHLSLVVSACCKSKLPFRPSSVNECLLRITVTVWPLCSIANTAQSLCILLSKKPARGAWCCISAIYGLRWDPAGLHLRSLWNVLYIPSQGLDWSACTNMEMIVPWSWMFMCTYGSTVCQRT